MTEQSLAEPVPKRADQLRVGDRVPDKHLPYQFNKGPAEVVFVANEPGKEPHTFFAYRYPNGVHDGTTVRAEADLLVYPRAESTALHGPHDEAS